MCRVLHLLREPGEEEVEVLRPSDDVAQVLEDRLQIGCRSAADRLQIGCTSAATSSSGTGGRRSARRKDVKDPKTDPVPTCRVDEHQR